MHALGWLQNCIAARILVCRCCERV